MMRSRHRATDRAWTIALGLWIAGAALAMLLAPPPPEAPVVPPGEQEIWERTAAWAQRDARRWQAEEGDLSIPWRDAGGHLAIVIDDVGRELHVLDKLVSLRFPLTFSVLPGAVYAPGAQLRLRADHRRYREIMLHLPMEPTDPAQMSAGREARETFLRVDDGPAVLRAKLAEALARVPAAIGINNHMGSRLTANRAAMDALMPEIRAHGLYFVDSRTTAETRAAEAAAGVGIPTASRDVFLDHTSTVAAIASALDQAVAAARQRPAIAIGHPSVALYEVLRTRLPGIHRSGVGIYPVSVLLAHRGLQTPTVEPAPSGEKPHGEPGSPHPEPAAGVAPERAGP